MNYQTNDVGRIFFDIFKKHFLIYSFGAVVRYFLCILFPQSGSLEYFFVHFASTPGVVIRKEFPVMNRMYEVIFISEFELNLM